MIEGVSFGRRETITFVGALRVTDFAAPLTVDGLTVDGPFNGCIFLAWVWQHLVPTLAPGDIVVMDHLSSHKVKGVRGSDRISEPRSPLSATILARFESDQTCILETQEAAP